MPLKYHLETKPSPARSWVPGAMNLLDWEEGCLKCAVCVKKRCVYGVYANRQIDTDSLTDTLDSMCKNCLSCVQNCPRRLIGMTVNPEYRRIGNDHWTPAILRQIYYQAESGNIPVSGAGYGGPFSGPGFDGMWTDMSEIVRPTRDGIHGREYISTTVDLGRKPGFVKFSPSKGLEDSGARYVEAPMPFIMSIPEDHRLSPSILEGMIAASMEMKAFFLVPAQHLGAVPKKAYDRIIPLLSRETLWPEASAFKRFKIVEVEYWEGMDSWLKVFNGLGAGTVLSVRMPFSPGFENLLVPLVRAGVDILHLVAGDNGLAPGAGPDQGAPHLKDLTRIAHMTLVEAGLRNEVTIVVGGGLAMAEHVAKAVVCGADAATLDLALWAALECRLCGNCLDRKECPVHIESAPAEWAKQRIINLNGAWRNQLLEVLGAMGLREFRRLRGEVGRAMFFEQLEEESFAPIFGKRKGQKP